jgi:hypothetical protein
MGGFGGEVRAKTPDEAWATFNKEVRPEAEERFGLILEAPQNREAAFKAMRQDLKMHCWVLDYYFSK